MNTNSVDTINQVGVEIFMGFEGQIGSLPTWMNRTWTKFDDRPWMADNLQARVKFIPYKLKAFRADSLVAHYKMIYVSKSLIVS